MSGAAKIRAVTPKLAALLPRLASDHDGEVVATARAIGRVLNAAGCDWHDLVAALSPKVVAVEFGPRTARRPPTPRQPRDAPTGEGHRALMAMMAATCAMHDLTILNGKEVAFACEMMNKLRLGGRLGAQQEARLRALYERIRVAA